MLLKSKLSLVLSTILVGSMIFMGCGGKNSASTSKNTTNSKTQSESKDTSKENEKVIKVGTTGTYAPFTFKKDDVLKGFEIDVWNEIGKRTGYKIDYVLAGWTGLFGMLDTNKIDTICHQISITDKRKEKYDFSAPYAYNPLNFTVRIDEDKINSIKDFAGRKIGIPVGGNEEAIIKANDPEGKINMVYYEDASGMLKEIELGRIDGILQSKVRTLQAIKEGNLKLKTVGEPLELETNAYPFGRTDRAKKILEITNDAIKSMHEDGTLTEISNKWFGSDITKNEHEK